MKYLIISASLNPKSTSRTLIKHAYEKLKSKEKDVHFIDLREYPIPLCDGNESYNDENVKKLSHLIQKSDGILIASPIYNYDVNAAIKNLVELSGKAWQDKVVGFVCAAGGRGSYMSVMPFANSLMLDFRCLIIPRFIYSTESINQIEHLEDETVLDRIEGLVDRLLQITEAVN